MSDTFKHLHDQAYDYLLDKILAGDFEEDRMYSETGLAEELQISRTPLHNALLQLSQEGYIDILPSRGFKLQRITPKDLREIYQVCVALESFCAFMISRDRTTEHARATIAELEDNLKEQEEIVENGCDIDRFIKCDYDFHNLIISYSQNELFKSRFKNYRNRIKKYLLKSFKTKTRIPVSLSEHRAICSDIKNGKIENLMKCMEVHHDDFRHQKI